MFPNMQSSNVRILHITPGSDGDGRKWPKHHYTRNDDYFKERIATDKWIKDLPGGAVAGVIYRLDKLPNGYAGFERSRPDSKHVDRYIYGHPNGQFRSLNEFYPHFKHLMDNGGPAGCTCSKCMGSNGKKRLASKLGADSGNNSGASLPQRSQYFSKPDQKAKEPEVAEKHLISPYISKQSAHRPGSESPKPRQRKLLDCEGTVDTYESMIVKLREAGPEESVDLPIREQISPDWRTTNIMTKDLYTEWRKLPRYVPRTGELVLFVRKINDGEAISWNKNSHTFHRTDMRSKIWRGQPQWEAGVVTQMPRESISDLDLITDENKVQGVNYSGFRIEPLSEPGKDYKPYTKQYKHVPLFAIRPFAFWQDCLNGVPEHDWHATVVHALTVMSSFCVVGKYRFKGTWPDATVFCRGAYLGSELILVGDTVRLLPRKREKQTNAVVEVMAVTAIRLRFVNLDLEDDDMSPVPEGLPYQTCLHFSGQVYTLNPMRSFDGVGKIPINVASDILPSGLGEYGQWYHYSDPEQTSARIELPYTRILGRCFEDIAATWFSAPKTMPPPPANQSTNKKPVIVKDGDREISRGLEAIMDARDFSRKNDKRITSQEGKAWFWADTRVEQLDLHEVNGRWVGVKNQLRTKGEMAKWRAAIKALDGKKGGLEEVVKMKQAAKEAATPNSSSYGMVAASRQMDTESPTEGEGVEGEEDDDDDDDGDDDDDEDAMDVDEQVETRESSSEVAGDRESSEEESQPAQTTVKTIETITLSGSENDDDDDDDEMARVSELAKNIRANVR